MEDFAAEGWTSSSLSDTDMSLPQLSLIGEEVLSIRRNHRRP